MTIQPRQHDAHHDLTWLIGALARALFVRLDGGGQPLTALRRLAACDFSAPPRQVTHAIAPACRWLPEALAAALLTAEEVAMALAAAHEHLCWRQAPEAAPAKAAASAAVLGMDAPLPWADGSLRMLLTAPQARLPFCASSTTLLLTLSGEAAFRDAHGALRHAPAGEIAMLPAETHLMSVARAPLLAALLHT